MIKMYNIYHWKPSIIKTSELIEHVWQPFTRRRRRMKMMRRRGRRTRRTSQ